MAATLRRSSEATFNGADGVVWSRNSWTTPPRPRELMWLRDFLLIAHPPLLLLRRGADCCNSQSVICFGPRDGDLSIVFAKFSPR